MCIRDRHIVKKIAAYIILGVNDEGKKEVLSITIGENESAKYWLGVLNELKNRGVRDILILCADGLSGIKESIAAAYPNTEYQRCIVPVSYTHLDVYKRQDISSVYGDRVHII